MSIYNYLDLTIECPQCHRVVDVRCELWLGVLELQLYRLGDVVNDDQSRGPRVPRESLIGRTFTAEGYATCSACGKDFFLNVVADDRVIIDAVVNKEKPGYVE